jgi:3-oxoacyl-[acyl-carrier protein] reductase
MAISNGLRPGLGMVAKALSDELGPRGIRVNGLMPAWVSTSRAVELSAAGHDKPLNSLRRRGTAEEFGRVATFLLSSAASYVTGALIAVDGGALPNTEREPYRPGSSPSSSVAVVRRCRPAFEHDG